MKSILQSLLRGFAATNIGILTAFITLIGFNQSIIASLVTGIVGGVASNYLLKWRGQAIRIKESQLTKKEYYYIQRNLKEAKEKLNRLNKALLTARSLRTAKHVGKLQRMVSQIYQIVAKEPKKFYQADRFFFYHLDSIVELSERYVLLSRQPIKAPEIQQSIMETEQTLAKFVDSLEDDIITILADDITHLNIELDAAKQAFDYEESLLPYEKTKK